MLQVWWAGMRHECACAAAAAITVQDIRNVEALAAEPNVLDILARSLAPSIYGHFLIKKALVLLLLGGRCAFMAAPYCRRGRQLLDYIVLWIFMFWNKVEAS